MEIFGKINSETPPYDVISKKADYEIRRYGKYILAKINYEVPKETDFSDKSGTGFYPLFKYITGKNQTETKISMTAPVIMQQNENATSIQRTMSFIMSPSTFKSLDQLPAAKQEGIEIIEESNSRDLACITFNMSISTEKLNEKEKQLRDAAKRDGIELSTNPNDVLYFGYNPPFTIPYFRRNEICIPIIHQQ